MYHVGESSSFGHVKGVDVHLAKKRARNGNYGRDINLMEVSGLTDVARVCKPLDIHAHVGPPETLDEMRSSGIRTAMTYLVVSLSEQLETTTWGYDNLVVSVRVLTPEVVSVNEKAKSVADESMPLGFDDAFRTQSGLKDVDDKVETTICCISIWGTRDEDGFWIGWERSEVEGSGELASKDRDGIEIDWWADNRS